jgi:hypothetical protein
VSDRVAQVHDQRVEIVGQEATYAVALDGPGYLPQLGDATLALRHIVLPGRAEVLVALSVRTAGFLAGDLAGVVMNPSLS